MLFRSLLAFIYIPVYSYLSFFLPGSSSAFLLPPNTSTFLEIDVGGQDGATSKILGVGGGGMCLGPALIGEGALSWAHVD